MSIDFILPDIGEGIVECELVEWLVNEGEIVEEDQPIADVMTDKALVQIPAMHAGKIDKLYYNKGDIAKVHAPLFSMTANDDAQSHAEVIEQPVTEHIVESSVENGVKNNAPMNISNNANSENDATGYISEDFILPDIGEGIVECELVDWLVNEGDIIEEDQAVADVMTDKALVQIPAMYAGKVTKLYYHKGEIAKVHAPLFAIERLADASSSVENSQPQACTQVKKESTEHSEKLVKAIIAEPANSESVIPAQVIANAKSNVKAIASPAVRRVARELNVDICQVAGSGSKGRVYKDDVLVFSQQGNTGATGASTALVAHQNNDTIVKIGGSRVEAIRGVKAIMAKAMVASVNTIPHFTYCEEIDITDLLKIRTSLKAVYAKQDIKLTMMPFFMKAISLALKEYPIINSQVNDNCTEITYFDDHNIGMAVDSKIGLLVPNVKQVQTKSILELATEITRLTDSARSGRVDANDLKGGTISVSNIGALGGTVATPIINKPEAAIVALGKMQTLPRFNEQGDVEARAIMQVSWSGDHRIIDGGTIARFCNLWKSFLENPTTMMMHMN